MVICEGNDHASTILIVILILALIGALPIWGYSRNWGYIRAAAWACC